MNTTDTVLTDAWAEANRLASGYQEKLGIVGYGVLELRDSAGRLKRAVPFANLITDAGDLYYAQMGIAGVSPATPTAPTLMSGMKLGTGTTSASKAGAGAALVTYISGSNNPFDATYPTYSNLGSGLGVNAVFKTSWAAGDVTNSAITEVVIVNDAGTDATSSAANTASRATFTAVDKQSGDSLAITWNHKFLGA